MKRADVVLVDLDPTVGSEANKLRPAVIVSNDGNNRATANLGRGTITVLPITSSVGRVYAFQYFIPAGIAGLTKDSKVQAEQIRTIDISRVTRVIGHLDPVRMKAVDGIVALHLGL